MFINKPKLYNSRILLVEPWRITNTKGIILAAIVSFLGAAFSYFLQVCKVKVQQKLILIGRSHNYTRFHIWYFILSSMYTSLTALNYILMLIVMTYDVVLLTAVITGTGFGYFLTDKWKEQRRRDEQLLVYEVCDNNHNDATSATSDDNHLDESEILITQLEENTDLKESTV